DVSGRARPLNVMVCDACQKKLVKIVGVDPYRNKTHNKLQGVSKKPIPAQNKLIGQNKKTELVTKKCRICKCNCHQPGCHYCQNCAYQKGICAMCGKKILDTKCLKQTSV
ncbi:hypothetical protein PRIPAC_83610, partial [Pristionchus pacificus]|uniref:Cysteine-rich PDZ-binding protein n=1 Tax=Pristionchus pacificus TaxID=54126 RepID=A0A8R1YZI4_PRIPA